MIHNKSGHPVEVKKISIRVWSLRDEIEAALERRMKECEAAAVPLYIEDIKKFYNLNYVATPDNILALKPKAEEGMNSLMEEIGEDAKKEEATKPEGSAEGESKALTEAEEIVAEQTLQGMDNKKPNPILDRPYQRQAPDLNKISYGFVLLSDINMESVMSFGKDKFLQGQSVTIEFLIPQAFMMTADVTYCHHYARTSRIISSTKPDYRLQCRFNFTISGERDNLRNFLKSVEPTIPKDPKKAKKEAEDGSAL